MPAATSASGKSIHDGRSSAPPYCGIGSEMTTTNATSARIRRAVLQFAGRAEPVDQVPGEEQVERGERERPAPLLGDTARVLRRARPRKHQEDEPQHQRQVERAVLDLDQQAEAGGVDVEAGQHDGDRVTSMPTGPTRRRKLDSWSNWRISFACCSAETASMVSARVRAVRRGCGHGRRSVRIGRASCGCAGSGVRAQRDRTVAPRREVDGARATTQPRRLVGVHPHHDDVEAALHRHDEAPIASLEGAALVCLRGQARAVLFEAGSRSARSSRRRCGSVRPPACG